MCLLSEVKEVWDFERQAEGLRLTELGAPAMDIPWEKGAQLEPAPVFPLADEELVDSAQLDDGFATLAMRTQYAEVKVQRWLYLLQQWERSLSWEPHREAQSKRLHSLKAARHPGVTCCNAGS